MTSVYTEFTKEAGSLGGPAAFRDHYFDKGREVAVATGAVLLAKAREENVAMLAKGRGQGLVAGALLVAGAIGVWAVKKRAARTSAASPERAAGTGGVDEA